MKISCFQKSICFSLILFIFSQSILFAGENKSNVNDKASEKSLAIKPLKPEQKVKLTGILAYDSQLLNKMKMEKEVYYDEDATMYFYIIGGSVLFLGLVFGIFYAQEKDTGKALTKAGAALLGFGLAMLGVMTCCAFDQ